MLRRKLISNKWVVCQKCGKEFEARGLGEARVRKYCSRMCRYEADKVKKIILYREQCGKEIHKLPCLIHNTNYCSVECKRLGHRKNKDPMYRKCWICGTIKLVTEFGAYKLKSNNYKCKQCERQRSKERMRSSRGRFVFAKNLAKRRELTWNIPFETYVDLLTEKCHYCGSGLNETGIGLDRKNNKFGYDLGNVVSCCGLCNITKSDNFSYEEMLYLGESIKAIIVKRENHEHS